MKNPGPPSELKMTWLAQLCFLWSVALQNDFVFAMDKNPSLPWHCSLWRGDKWGGCGVLCCLPVSILFQAASAPFAVPSEEFFLYQEGK
jgi:hypothetical protein